MRFYFHSFSTVVAKGFFLQTCSFLSASQRRAGPATGLLVSRCRIPTKLPVFLLRSSVYMRKQDCKYPTWMLWNKGKGGKKRYCISADVCAVLWWNLGCPLIAFPEVNIKWSVDKLGRLRRKWQKNSHFNQAAYKSTKWILGKGGSVF